MVSAVFIYNDVIDNCLKTYYCRNITSAYNVTSFLLEEQPVLSFLEPHQTIITSEFVALDFKN